MSDCAQGLESVTAVILAGGLGTRLRSIVSDVPKVLAKVLGRPFITYLLDQLAQAGVREVVLSTGYKGGVVTKSIGDRYKSLHILYSPEDEPLGTGGALELAARRYPSDPMLVMNGDSFIDADLKGFLSWFCQLKCQAGLIVTQVSDTSRFGAALLRDDGLVLGFQEKGANGGPGLINAGVYLFRKEFLAALPHGRFFQLEHELFPRLAGTSLYAYRCQGRFIDIGTSDSYVAAERFFSPMN